MAAPASSRWDRRIDRARLLAHEHPAARELLSFYAALAEYQRALGSWYAERVRLADPPPDSLRAALDTRLVLEAVPDFVSWLQRTGPASPASAAAEAQRVDAAAWRAELDMYLGRLGADTEPARPPIVFVLEAVLQPLAEQLAVSLIAGSGEVRRPVWDQDRRGGPSGPPGQGGSQDSPLRPAIQPSASATPATTLERCPFCDGRPVVGVLREEAEGARRNLVCGLCLTEWHYVRVVCSACGERQFDALPVFTAEQFPAARLDACDTCRRYLKTVDATKDGHAVAIVDDLASVPLDLWAREQGYVRLRPNLLRV